MWRRLEGPTTTTNVTTGHREARTRADGTFFPRAVGLPRFAAGRRLVVPVLIFSDVCVALLAWGAASAAQAVWGRGPLSGVTVPVVLVSVAVWVLMRALLGLYPGYGVTRAEELRRQTYAAASTLAVVATIAVAWGVGGLISRMMLFLAFAALLLAAPMGRFLTKRWLTRVGLWGRPVVLMGCGAVGAQLLRMMRREWELGFEPVAVFDDREEPAGGLLEGVPYGGSLADATYLARDHKVDTLVFAMPNTGRKNLAKYVDLARLNFRHVVVVPNLGGITNSAVVARDFAGIFGVEIRYNLLDPNALRSKRALDLICAAAGGALILPLLAVLCLLVWAESGGPVFYRAQRMGRNGRLFSCLKFRTMVPDAEERLRSLLSRDAAAREEYAKYHKLREDPRVTRVGRLLRKTSLDELPQLWNVLKGEMSLVGPRPYLPRESADIGVTQSEILRVPPGITGPWQVAGRNHASFDDRVRMDVDYVRDWSVWVDLTLLARTVKTLLLDRSAY